MMSDQSSKNHWILRADPWVQAIELAFLNDPLVRVFLCFDLDPSIELDSRQQSHFLVISKDLQDLLVRTVISYSSR